MPDEMPNPHARQSPSEDAPTPTRVPLGDATGATSDRAFDALTESQQLSEGAQLLLATALVDAVQGRNEHHRFSSLRDEGDASLLAFIEDSAPPMLAKYATVKLHARSNHRNAIEVLSETLRGIRGDEKPKNFLKTMFGR